MRLMFNYYYYDFLLTPISADEIKSNIRQGGEMQMSINVNNEINGKT